MKNQEFIEQFLRKLTPGQWYDIRTIPRVIGLTGISDAVRKQILLPDYEILMGRLYASFKIIRVKTETLRIMERIEKRKIV